MKSDPSQDETLFVDATWKVRQEYRIDPVLDRFFDGLRDGVLLAGRVPSSGRLVLPPRSFCERTGEPVEELVAVGPGGVVRAITQVTTPFPGAPKPPYWLACVQFDGASTAVTAYLRGVDAAQPPGLGWIGRRCQAVFGPERRGHWSDFWLEPQT